MSLIEKFVEAYQKKIPVEVIGYGDFGTGKMCYKVQNEGNSSDQWLIDEETFERTYEKIKQDFGWAVRQMKLGKKVARWGWNGAGMFAYLVPANQYPASTEAARSHFGEELVPYREYMALKTAQGDVATWAPSGSDCLAEDWTVVK